MTRLILRIALKTKNERKDESLRDESGIKSQKIKSQNIKSQKTQNHIIKMIGL